MKLRKWFQSIIIFILTTLLLDACTFSVQVLTTPSASPLPLPSASPTAVQIPASPTAIPASATPTVIPIQAGTVSMLETFNKFALSDVVRGLAFTPDGAVLAVAIGNFEHFGVYLWDVPNEQLLYPLDGHTDIVWNVAFSPDGNLLASVSSDKTAKIWDWRSKTLLKSLDFPGEVVSVAFSPDGRTLAVGGVDEPVNRIQNAAVWTYSVGSWQLLRKFPEYMNIAAMAYSPKGGIIIGGGTSRNVQVWNASDGDSLFTLNHAHQVSRVAISPDGSTVATATCEIVTYPECTNGGVWLWELPTGKLKPQKLAGFADFVEHVIFTADGSLLIAASRDGTLRFYETSKYQSLLEYTTPGGISALALSPDSGLLATGNSDGEVYLWKIVYRP